MRSCASSRPAQSPTCPEKHRASSTLAPKTGGCGAQAKFPDPGTTVSPRRHPGFASRMLIMPVASVHATVALTPAGGVPPEAQLEDRDQAGTVNASERRVRQGLLEIFSVTPIQSNPVSTPDLLFHSCSRHKARIRFFGTDRVGQTQAEKSVVAIQRAPAVHEKSNGADYFQPGQQLLRNRQALDVLVEAQAGEVDQRIAQVGLEARSLQAHIGPLKAVALRIYLGIIGITAHTEDLESVQVPHRLTGEETEFSGMVNSWMQERAFGIIPLDIRSVHGVSQFKVHLAGLDCRRRCAQGLALRARGQWVRSRRVLLLGAWLGLVRTSSGRLFRVVGRPGFTRVRVGGRSVRLGAGSTVRCRGPSCKEQ